RQEFLTACVDSQGAIIHLGVQAASDLCRRANAQQRQNVNEKESSRQRLGSPEIGNVATIEPHPLISGAECPGECPAKIPSACYSTRRIRSALPSLSAFGRPPSPAVDSKHWITQPQMHCPASRKN